MTFSPRALDVPGLVESLQEAHGGAQDPAEQALAPANLPEQEGRWHARDTLRSRHRIGVDGDVVCISTAVKRRMVAREQERAETIPSGHSEHVRECLNEALGPPRSRSHRRKDRSDLL